MSEHFNPQKILTICEDDIETAKSIIEMFIADTPKRLASAKTAVSSDDLEEAKRNIHSIKGAAINIGATKISNIAREIENNINNADYINSSPMAELAYAVDKTIIEMKEWLNTTHNQ